MAIPTNWLSNVDWVKVLTLTWGSGTTAYATQMAMSAQIGGVHPPQSVVLGYAIFTAIGTFISSILNTQKPQRTPSDTPTDAPVDQPEPPAKKVEPTLEETLQALTRDELVAMIKRSLDKGSEESV